MIIIFLGSNGKINTDKLKNSNALKMILNQCTVILITHLLNDMYSIYLSIYQSVHLFDK